MFNLRRIILTAIIIYLTDGATCPNNWSAHDDTCYFFSRDVESWPGSVVMCQTVGANLVEIENLTEDNFIRQNIRGPYAWIGLTDVEEEGQFKWMTSHTDLSYYSHWSPGEPNSANSNENCVIIRSQSKGNGWDDDSCYKTHNYVCEKKSG